jgi:hypothetical protein
MSMLRAFEKLLNPDRDEAETRELREATERANEEAAGPPTLVCKACAYRGAEQYCPRCLADTMRPVRRRSR